MGQNGNKRAQKREYYLQIQYLKLDNLQCVKILGTYTIS